MKRVAVPISVRLDPSLLRKATAFAKRRRVGISTALRLIVGEHLDAEESAADLDAALRWQRERAWEALDRASRGEGAELSLDDLRTAHRDALRKPRSR